MIYKDYQSFRVKHGSIDVFVIEYDGKQSIQVFMTDHLSHSTSPASFTPEQFETFISKRADKSNVYRDGDFVPSLCFNGEAAV